MINSICTIKGVSIAVIQQQNTGVKPPPIQNLSFLSSSNNSFLISFTDPSNVTNYDCTCIPTSGTTKNFSLTNLNDTTNVILGNTLTSSTTYTISVSSNNGGSLSDPVTITAMTLHDWAGLTVNNTLSTDLTLFRSYNINNTGFVNTLTTVNVNTDESFIIQSANGVQMNSRFDPSFNQNGYTYATAYSFSNMLSYIRGNNDFTFYLKCVYNGGDTSNNRYWPLHLSSTLLPGSGSNYCIYCNVGMNTKKITLAYSDNNNSTNIFLTTSNAFSDNILLNTLNVFIVSTMVSTSRYIIEYVYDNNGNLLFSASGLAPNPIFNGYNTCAFGLASIYTYSSMMNILYFNVYQTALSTSQMSNFSNNNTSPYL